MANNLITSIIIRARDEASSVFGSLQAKVAGVAAAISAFFGAALFKSSIDSAREFESAMASVRAAAGASAEEFAVLEEAAQAAGTSTQYSAVQAANALEELVKAGLDATQAVEALPAALDLATAGQIGLADAAGYITQAVAGMGLSFAEAGRVADVLALGANATKTSVEGLGQALSYAAPIANSLGLSLEETVAYLGKFSDAGIDASRAGTALNAILAQFIDPSSKFSQALRDAGIESRDFNVAMRELAEAGPGASKALLAVGTEAGPALRALLNQGTGALDELVEKLEGSEGSARTFAGVVSSTLDGAAKNFGSAWEGLLIKLGTPVLDTLARQVTAVADQLRAFVADGTATKFGETLKEAFESAGKWAGEFFGKVDFAKLQADMQQYAQNLQATLTDLGNRATTAGNVLSLVWATMSTGIETVRTAIYSLGSIMSWLTSAFLADMALIADGIAKVTFGDLSAGFSEAAAKMRFEAQATYAVYQDFQSKAGEAFAGVVEGADDVGAAWDRLHAPAEQAVADLTAVGTAAAGATGQTAGLAQGMNDVASALAGFTSQQVAEKLAEISAETGVAVKSTRDLSDAVRDGYIYFNEASGAWQKGSTNLENLAQFSGDAEGAMRGFVLQLQASSEEAATAETNIATLRAEYLRLIAAGDTQGAAQVLVEIRQELERTGSKAESTADDVEGAFERLGIASSASLKQAAASAKRDFEIIRASGTSTPADVQAAFDVYAKAAIAANGGVASSALKALAAVLRLRLAGQQAGEGLDTVGEGADKAGKGAETAAGGMNQAAGAAKNLGGASKLVKEQFEGALEAIKALSTEAEKATREAYASSKSFEDFASKVDGLSASASKFVGFNEATAEIQEFRDAADLARAAAEKLEQQARFEGHGWKAFDEALASMSRFEAALNDARAAAIVTEQSIEKLDDEISRLGSGRARGLEDLELRLLSINGTEEEIAQARARRESAELEMERKKLQLEIQRAQLRGDYDDVSFLQQEIKLLNEYAQLLTKVHAEEKKARADARKEKEREERDRERERERSRTSSSGGSGTGGNVTPTQNPSPRGEEHLHLHIEGVLDVNDRVTLDKLARKLKPVTDNLARRGM